MARRPAGHVRRAGNAERVAHDHRAPGHARLVDGGHGAHAVADGGGLLRLQPDQEARTVAQIDDRQVEGLGHVDEAHDLGAGVRRPGAAVVVGIARQDRHRQAVEAREAGDHRPPEHLAHLEERALVDDCVDDGAHLVDLAPVARDDAEQALLAPVGRIAALGPRRDAVDRRRQVGQEAAGAGERLLLGVDGMIDGAGPALHLPAAELLLAQVLADAGYHGRAGHEHGRGRLGHDRSSGWPPAARRRGPRPSRAPARRPGTVAEVVGEVLVARTGRCRADPAGWRGPWSRWS